MELVSSRKKDIEENQDPSQIQGLAARVAAGQDISRAELAKWDSSARAWLLSADEVQKVKLTQLRLTTRDCGLHVSSLRGTYASVIEVWTTSMRTVQDLIVGMPQRISKGAVLVAISAWHIYPDLHVVGPLARVPFNDNLVAAGGVITIGLQTTDPDKQKGVQWSLSLSHLRYYGPPVDLCNTAGDASLRITMQELHWAALGSLFAAWAPCVTDDITACEFLLALRDAVNCSGGIEMPWLQLLWDASQSFLELPSSIERHNASSLIALGRRKGHMFLHHQHNFPLPLFGLASPMLVDWFSWITPPHGNNMIGYMISCIHFLRDLVLQRGSSADQYVIRYHEDYDQLDVQVRRNREPRPLQSVFLPCRYTTACPISIDGVESAAGAKRLWHRIPPISLLKRKERRDIKANKAHCHWIPVSGLTNYGPQEYGVARQMAEHIVELDPAPKYGVSVQMAERIVPRAIDFNVVLDQQDLPANFISSSLTGDTEYESESLLPSESACFDFVAGNPHGIALFKLKKADEDDVMKNSLKDTDITSLLRSGKINSERVSDYLTKYSFQADVAYAARRQEDFSGIIEFAPIRSLSNLAYATQVYDQLPGATVSILALNFPLFEARWSYVGKSMPNPYYRSNKFACIATFESGYLNLAPHSLESVMAMSSGNSIFTLTSLLQEFSNLDYHDHDMTRILGNLNRPGIVMLVPPHAPLVRQSDPGAWRVVNHAAFDGKSIDAFTHTTLHLSFTDYEMPLIVQTGVVDAEVTILESLVSVYDRKDWTADIDVVSHVPTGFTSEREQRCCHIPSENKLPPGTLITRLGKACRRRLVSIDSWDELLDPPERLGETTLGVLRAVGNWQARLAAFTVCNQLGYRTAIRPISVCDDCLVAYELLDLMQILIL